MSQQPEKHDPLDRRAQEAAQAEQAKAEQLQRYQEVEDFKWLMAYKQGRRIMWRMLGLTGLFRNAFVPGDQAVTGFRCGEQNIGHKLLNEIHTLCPEKYHEMVKEQQRHDRSRTRRSNT